MTKRRNTEKIFYSLMLQLVGQSMHADAVILILIILANRHIGQVLRNIT